MNNQVYQSLQESLVDWMYNGFEHCENVNTEAKEIVQYSLPEHDHKENIPLLEKQVTKLMQAWLDNEDNIRIDISLNFKNTQSNHQKVLSFISKYINS